MVGAAAGTQPRHASPGCTLADCHVHLGFMSNAEQVAEDAQREGLLLFVNTVTPQEYLELQTQPWTQLPNVRLGVGLHPWWVARGEAVSKGVALACKGYSLTDDAATLASQARWVGEVGLDFSPKHTDPSTNDAQVAALRSVLKACATPFDAGRRTISIHSVASADAVLDLLEETGATTTCNCVFHWFSGSTPALWRAIHLGCWFSVNERQARTRRAKEQLKLVPAERLLLETDYPPTSGEPFSAKKIRESLLSACSLLGHIRNQSPESIQALTTRNALALLDER